MMVRRQKWQDRRDMSLTSPKMGFYGKVLTTGTW